ncbi:MAG TPA: hypothetical protein PLZ84_04365 [Clostridia bacterium]|nr:hypothetical protein [Clostridia bacterium]
MDRPILRMLCVIFIAAIFVFSPLPVSANSPPPADHLKNEFTNLKMSSSRICS